MEDYFFVSSDGHLYDARVENWYKKAPRRKNYRFPHTNINTVSQLKSTLRYGAYAWPGGYPLYFITSDGGALAFETVRKEFRQIAYSVKHRLADGWRVVGCDVNWEDATLTDDHTGKRIPSAYENDDEGETK